MASTPATTIYANVVNFRLTPGEFVLEFGAHFPDRPNQGPPSDFRPDVRVVLPPGALQGILQALTRAVEERQKQSAPSASKQAPGFGAGSGPTKDTP